MAVIEVKDIKKKFRLYSDKGNSLKEKLLFRRRRHYEEHWVLNGISFKAEKGEAIGLIGENGCGKSTLLKLMSRIMYPDSGSIEIKGRVSSLIELGAGFHPNMSGRENIYTNAAIFGLTRDEIDMRLQTIIDFSELGEYIENPVRTYSSGMYMRLAFSVAINVDADVLLIDEILAVGDANFQAKCFEKLRELKAGGVTIVIVTHDMGTVESFCTRALWLNDGAIQARGKAAHVVDAYLKSMNEKRYNQELQQNQDTDWHSHPQEPDDAPESPKAALSKDNESPPDEVEPSPKRYGARQAEITQVHMYGESGATKTIFKSGEKIHIASHYKKNKHIDNYVFGIGITTLDDNVIMGTNTMLDRIDIPTIQERGTVTAILNSLPLLSGMYILQVAIHDENDVALDFYREYTRFSVVSDDRSIGIVSIPHTWQIE